MAYHSLLHSDSSDQRLRHRAGIAYCSCADWRGFSDISFDVSGGLAHVLDGILHPVLHHPVEPKHPFGIVVAVGDYHDLADITVFVPHYL